MSRNRKAILLSLTCVLLILSGRIYWFTGEATFGGVRISAWFERIQEAEATGRSSSYARFAFRQLGAEAIPFLESQLKTADGKWAHRFTEWYKVSPPLLRPFFPSLARPVFAKAEAARALGDLGPKAASCVPHLIALLGPNEPVQVRHAALCALTAIGVDAEQEAAMFGAIEQMLPVNDLAINNACYWLLGSLKTQPQSAVPMLIDGLSTRVSNQSNTCVGALVRMGSPALPFLKAHAHDTNSPQSLLREIQADIQEKDFDRLQPAQRGSMMPKVERTLARGHDAVSSWTPIRDIFWAIVVLTMMAWAYGGSGNLGRLS